ncbi:syntaxin-17 [Biomphalaria glabrata]|nr:syntaxin-17 [Biomphalaria glabrata]
MSGFNPEERMVNQSNGDVTKYPMKRLELSIKKFIKVLDIDLDRLYKHTISISRLINAEDWNNLHKEQVNASRTIQQIQANIKEIEKARKQVNDEELSEFDARVEGVKLKAIESMKEFMAFAGMKADESHEDLEKVDSGSSNSISAAVPVTAQSGSDFKKQTSLAVHSEDESDSPQTTFGSLPAVLHAHPSETLHLHVVPQNSEATASWEELQENILELNVLVHEFSSRVEEQKEKITSIEENIDNSHENIKEGTQHLAKAAKYKSALLPVVGAVVGGVVAGPVGLVAGMKIGGLAGAVGGAVGYASGRLVKSRQDKISSMELENMSDKRSVSLPELPESERKLDKRPSQSVDNTQQEDDSGIPAEGKSDDVFTSVTSSVTSSFRKFFSMSDE